MAGYRGQSCAILISVLVGSLAAIRAESATPASRAAVRAGEVSVGSSTELPTQLIRQLQHGSATGQRQAIELLRTEYFDRPKVSELLVELGDRWIQIEGKQAELLGVIETLGVRPPDDRSREALLRWLSQCLQIPQTLNKSTSGVLTEMSQPPSEPKSARIDATPSLSEWSAIAPRQRPSKSAPRSTATILTQPVSAENLDPEARISPPRLVATLLLALRTFDAAEVRQVAMRLLQHDDPRVVLLAIDILGIQQHEAAVEPIINLTQTPWFERDYAFRRAAVEALLRIGTPESADYLGLLQPSMSGQLRAMTDFSLEQLREQIREGHGVQEFGVEHQSLGKPGHQPKDSIQNYRTDPSVLKSRYQVPSFFGVPVYADRVTFVVDFSGTMKHPTHAQISRLDAAKRELIQVIQQLRPTQLFRVIGFDSTVAPLSPSLVPATPANVRQFAARLLPIRGGGGTNLYGGLEAALQDSTQPELILLLSDGEPNAGRITDPAAILRAIRDENMFRRVTISTVSVGCDSELLQLLALGNAGDYRRID